MKIALSWLLAYLPSSVDLAQVVESLHSVGIEVEEVQGYAPRIENVVVAQIVSFAPHPNADKLRIATVFDGKEESKIVCGDLDCPENVKVPLAKIGAQLDSLTIKKTKIRGVVSSGMLCARDELGFAESSSGICILDPEAILGENAFRWLNEPLLSLSLTPNLGHCLHIESLAKQIQAKLGLPALASPLRPFAGKILPLASQPSPSFHDESGKAYGFTTLLVEGIDARASPDWLVQRLQQAGYKTGLAVEDAAQWVMLEKGRPLELFDADKVQGTLRLALLQKEQDFVCEAKERKLPAGTLLLLDEKSKILSLAGVARDEESLPTSATRRLLVTVALLEPQAVRRNSKAVGISTEASRRFERGLDPTSTEEVSARFLELLQEIGFQIQSATPFSFAKALEVTQIRLSCTLVERLLGLSMSVEEISKLLSRLDISCEKIDAETLLAQPPYARHDLKIAQDLVEELLKLLGTEALPRQTPTLALMATSHDPRYLLVQELRQQLSGSGLQETLSLDIVQAETCKELDCEATLLLQNPASSEADALRPTLLLGFLETLKQNQNRKIHTLSLFEIGSIYSLESGQTKERMVIGLFLTGQAQPHYWESSSSSSSQTFDFYSMKGFVERILQKQGLQALFESSHLDRFHPGQQAQFFLLDGTPLGHLGRLPPKQEKRLGSIYPLFYAQIDLELLKPALRSFQPLTDYPGSERDWTLTLEENLPFAEVAAALPHLEELEKVECLSLWRSEEKLGSQLKNLTLRFSYRHKGKTMNQGEVESQHLLLKEIVSRKLNLKN